MHAHLIMQKGGSIYVCVVGLLIMTLGSFIDASLEIM